MIESCVLQIKQRVLIAIMHNNRVPRRCGHQSKEESLISAILPFVLSERTNEGRKERNASLSLLQSDRNLEWVSGRWGFAH